MSNATAAGVFVAVSLIVIVAAVLIVRAYLRRVTGKGGCDVSVRNLIYVGLVIGACIAIAIAFDPGLHLLLSAAGATFTAFATFQQMK